MVIDRLSAQRFIQTYQPFLESLLSEEETQANKVLQRLVLAREHFAADRSLLDTYRATHPEADGEMLDAIATMRLGRWVYLKDTRAYSLLLDEDGKAGYAVLGLTDRLRVVTGGESGLVMLTALIALNGRWVCDGLIKEVVWLGKNMRSELNAHYQTLRHAGRFSDSPAHPV